MRRLATALVVLALAAAGAYGEAARDGSEPAATFRRVWTEEMPAAERVRLLESIAKDHPESEWADDALWALGEAARQEGLPGRMIHYWQYMLTVYPQVELEDFTRSLPLYRRSPLVHVEMLLLSEGLSFVPEEPHFVDTDDPETRFLRNARRFNPVPMVVWGELAEAYRRLDRLPLALKAYRRALDAAPRAGRFADSYRGAMRKVEAELEARPAAPPGRPAAAVAADARIAPEAEQAEHSETDAPGGSRSADGD